MRGHVLFIAALLAAAVVSATRAADVPTYKLEPGQVLTYVTNMTWTKEKGEASGMEETVKISVVGKTADGWRVVTEQKQQFWQGKEKPAESTTQPARVQSSVGTGVVHADGRSETTDTTSVGDPVFRGNPLGVLVPLPTSADQEKYSVKLPGPRGMLEATVASRGERAWTIEADRVSADDAIYLSSNHSTVTFDVGRGLPVKWALSAHFDYSGKESGEGTCELKSVETQDVAALEQQAKDIATMQGSEKKYDTAMGNLKGDDEQMKKEADAALATLKSAADGIQSPTIRASLLSDVKEYEGYAKYSIDEAKRKATVENHPAADFSLEKIGGGGKVSLADLRGKVVVLDFWYRGCGWCMKAMPEIKQVAADYKDKGVVVLGMNIDHDEKDAQFVIDKMALNYDSLKTPDDVPAKFGVRGYPTLIVIDQKGIVRKMHVGYSPELREELSELLNGLLNG
ncbi:MAG: peroxiredoxin family protein [Phycisphaerae bacterium]